MGEPHVVSALKDKRAEIAGIIEDMERCIAQHRADLVHVDAVLRLYVPELEPDGIAPKAVRKRNDWFRPGELARLVLDVLRTAPAPLSTRDIAVRVMERRSLDAGDGRTVQLVMKLVSNAVTRQAAGLVERVTEGKVTAWRVRP
ncbi:hypothetical protein [Azospirillum sp. sgz302134]